MVRVVRGELDYKILVGKHTTRIWFIKNKNKNSDYSKNGVQGTDSVGVHAHKSSSIDLVKNFMKRTVHGKYGASLAFWKDWMAKQETWIYLMHKVFWGGVCTLNTGFMSVAKYFFKCCNVTA